MCVRWLQHTLQSSYKCLISDFIKIKVPYWICGVFCRYEDLYFLILDAWSSAELWQQWIQPSGYCRHKWTKAFKEQQHPAQLPMPSVTSQRATTKTSWTFELNKRNYIFLNRKFNKTSLKLFCFNSVGENCLKRQQFECKRWHFHYSGMNNIL